MTMALPAQPSTGPCFPRLDNAEKLRIIEEYYAETGRNALVLREFLEYVRARPAHPLYSALFERLTDEDAADRFRLLWLGQWVRTIRVEVTPLPVEPVRVKIKAMPVETRAMVSPLAWRGNGGGYRPVTGDAEDLREVALQVARRLREVADAAALLHALIPGIGAEIRALADRIERTAPSS